MSYFRSYDPTAGGSGALGVAERAKEVAARYATGRDLGAAWDEPWPATLDRASVADRARVVVTFLVAALTLGST